MGRRGFLSASAGLGLLAVLPAPADALAHPEVRRAARPLLGTRVDIVARSADPERLAPAFTLAFGEMARLERMMSRFRADSIVAELDRGAGHHSVEVPPPMMPVLMAAAERAERTGGAFDPTVGVYGGWRFDAEGQRLRQVPTARDLQRQQRLVGHHSLILEPKALRARLRHAGMRLDLGGIAKLPILQAGLQVLHRLGVQEALINGGGDIVASSGTVRPPWRVGLRDPRSPSRLLGILELADGVLAASGDYERAFEVAGQRYHHVLDPRTGLPTPGVRGVFLWSRQVHTVNGLGPAVMVAGPRHGRQMLQAREPTLEALIVDASGRVDGVGAMQRRLLQITPEGPLIPFTPVF